jgi:hypothetical protein
MAGPFSPNDNLIGPIAHQLALLIQAQIPSIQYVYEKLPDRSPQDNSVIMPLFKAKVTDGNVEGKVQIRFTFAIRHLFRRKEMPDNVAMAYSYLVPWILMTTAWPNQNLGGLARSVNPTDVNVIQVAESGQPMVALAVNVDVLTEFNVLTS